MPESKHPERTVILKDDALRSLQGFTQIPNVVLKHAGISFGAKVAFGVLLSYAWQDDFCYPAQERLAADLNCSVRQVRRLLAELKDGRFIDWKQQGLNRPNVYYILPKSDWTPSKPPTNKDGTDLSSPERTESDRTNMSPPDRTSMAGLERSNTADKVDSGKNIKNVNVNEVSDLQEEEKKNLREEGLVFEMVDVLGDRHSTGFYRKVARTMPEDLIFEVLSETKYQSNMGRVQKTRGAMFTDLIKRRARELGISLGPR